jgi:hypothetical protein
MSPASVAQTYYYTGLFLLGPNQVVLNSDQITCHKKLEVFELLPTSKNFQGSILPCLNVERTS